MNQQEKAQLAALAAFKEQAAKEARKAKIEREIAKYSNKATQRAIKHNMMALDLVEDVENTWNPVCEGAQAQDGIVIRADNLRPGQPGSQQHDRRFQGGEESPPVGD